MRSLLLLIGRSSQRSSLIAIAILISVLAGGMMPFPDALLASPALPLATQDVVPVHDATVGSAPGSASTVAGSARYSVPLVLPPGRAGMQPTLSLDYSSRGGSGIAGIGWDLGGLSSIHRCPKTIEQDGLVGAVRLDGSDRLCLDGQRLIMVDAALSPISGQTGYGNINAVYLTEVDSHVKVTQFAGSLASATSCFKVETREGEIHFYGGVPTAGGGCSGGAHSIPGGASVPLAWKIKQEQDRVGNIVQYNYGTYGTGEVLIDSIDYTGFTSSGGTTMGDRNIIFSYEALADIEKGSSYLAGTLTRRTQRLDHIGTYVGSTRVRQYNFGYTSTNYTGRSALTWFEECAYPAGSSTSICHPATDFAYLDSTSSTGANRWRHAFSKLEFPGLTSAMAQLPPLEDDSPGEEPTFDEYLDSFAPHQIEALAVQRPSLVREVGDFDGDGTRELLITHFSSTAATRYLAAFHPDRSLRGLFEVDTALGMTGAFAPGNQFIDANGDGRMDLVGNRTVSGVRKITIGIWKTTSTTSWLPSDFELYDTAVILPSGTGYLATCESIAMADVNGDGRMDILMDRPAGTSCAANLSAWQAENRVLAVYLAQPGGTNSLVPVYNTTPSVTVTLGKYTGENSDVYREGIEAIRDFDGDGLPDIFLMTPAERIKQNKIQRVLFGRRGSSYTLGGAGNEIGSYAALASPALEADETHKQAFARWADVNGDGLEDFVSIKIISGVGQWSVRLNKGGILGPRIVTTNNRGIEKCVNDLDQSSGTNNNCVTRWSPMYASKISIADVDADGRADLMVPRDFAARLCIQSKFESFPDEKYRYWCPEDPVTGALPPASDFIENPPVTPNAIHGLYDPPNAHPAPDSFRNDLDGSVYLMDVLRFAQANDSSFTIEKTETDITSGQTSFDMYGDGLVDTMGYFGWAFASDATLPIYSGYALPGSSGNLMLPDGVTPITTLATSRLTFISENRGTDPPDPIARAELIADLFNIAGQAGVPQLPELMRYATNGVGDWAAWNHAPLSLGSIPGVLQGGVPLYAIRSNRYADSRHYYFTSTMPIVTGMIQNTGVDVPSDGNTDGIGFRGAVYGYADAMYNHQGRGFQGFAEISSVKTALSADSNRSLRTTTTFHQKFPLAGMVASEVVSHYAQPDDPLSTAVYTWRCTLADRNILCPGDGASPSAPLANVVYTPYLDQRVDRMYDAASTLPAGITGVLQKMVTTINAAPRTTASGWDRFGNLWSQRVVTEDGSAGGSFVSSHSVLTTNAYSVDSTNWWVNKLTSTQVETSITYTAGHPLPAGVLAPVRTVTKAFEWNSDRTLWKETVQSGIASQQVITEYAYPSPSYGQPQSVTLTGSGATPATRTTQFVYTSNGTTAASPAGSGYFVLQETNPANHLTTTQRRVQDGQPTTVTGPTGLRSISTYDAFGRVTRVDYRTVSNAVLEPSTHMSLAWCVGGACTPAGYGEGAGQQFAVFKSTTIKDGSPTQVKWFDVLGRPVKEAVRGFDGTFIQKRIEYDTAGTVSRESVPHFAGGTAYWTTYDSYDTLSRVARKTSPGSEMDPTNGNVLTKYTYEGTKTAIRVQGATINESGPCPTGVPCMEMVRWHDALGRLVKSEDALHGITKYWFDGSNNAVAVLDAQSALLTATYNAVGHRLSRSDPDAGAASFTYDAFGQLLTQTDARDAVVINQYDAIGRLIQRDGTNPASSAGPAQESVRDLWVFDPVNGNGQLDYQKRQRGANPFTRVDVWLENYAYEADTRRLQSQTTAIEGESSAWVTGYTYDTLGREKTVAYPSGLTVERGFTSYGELSQLKNSTTGAVYWQAVNKDAWSQITMESFGNGMQGRHESYASTGQSKLRRWTTSSLAARDRLDYSYDSFGNLTSQSRQIAGSAAGAETYQYDALQRLTSATRAGVPGNPPAVTYGYTANGNLDYKSDISLNAAGAYSYGANGCGPHGVSSVLTSGGTKNFHCDANGSRIEDPDYFTVYDAQNFVRALLPKNVIGFCGGPLFQMAPDGSRYLQTGAQRRLVYGARGIEKETVYSICGGGGETERPAESGGNRSPTGTRWRHELGAVTVVRQGSVDTVNYVLRDRLGSTTALADTSQALSATRQFDAYGKPREGDQQDRDGLDLDPATLRGFTEHEHLTGGFIHMNGRLFDPAVGRFLSVDPIIQFPSNSQSLNPYSYVLNNPLSGTDPSGFMMSRLQSYMQERIDAQQGSCMGAEPCQSARDKAFLGGPAGALRDSLTAGGAPAGRGPRNGKEEQRARARVMMEAAADQIQSIESRNSSTGRCIARCNWESATTYPYKESVGVGLTPHEILQVIASQEHDAYVLGLVDKQGLEQVFTPIEELALGGGFKIASVALLGVRMTARQLAARTGATVFKTGHYASRLEAAGVNVARAESAVAKEVTAMRTNIATDADVGGRLRIDDVLVEYRARLLPDGSVNVGTIFPVR